MDTQLIVPFAPQCLAGHLRDLSLFIPADFRAPGWVGMSILTASKPQHVVAKPPPAAPLVPEASVPVPALPS